MKNFFIKFAKILIIGLVAVFLTTVGIDAVDRRDNLSESIVGRLIFGGARGPCPDDMVLVSMGEKNFCIDRFENSAGDSCPQTKISSQEQTRENAESAACKPISEVGKIPWRFVSEQQAANICAKAGKRLPTSAEWYAASLGTPDKSTNWTSDDCHVAKNWNQTPGLTGSGKYCQSGAGAFDMIGNVWEWVANEAVDGMIDEEKLPASGYVKMVDSQGIVRETSTDAGNPNFNSDYFWLKDSDIRGIARGGYWNNNSDAGRYSMYLEALSTAAVDGIGFRCAKAIIAK